MQCVCGQWFSVPVYKLKPKESVELCPSCVAASTPQSYVNSREWVQGTVSQGNTFQEQFKE